MILNGIEELSIRGDLLDRSLILNLPRIPDDKRMSEAELWTRFHDAAPRMLGSILDAVVVAMKNLEMTSLTTLPRMADFALWATADETGMKMPSGSFMRAYARNRESSNELALEANSLTKPLLEFMENNASWQGGSNDLLSLLDKIAGEKTRRLSSWPKTGSALTNKLKRLAPNLRAAGIEIEFGRTNKQRFLYLTNRKLVSWRHRRHIRH